MKVSLALAALLMAAAAAPAFADGSNTCLMRHQIDGWGARDKHSMVVNDRFGRKYLLNLAGVCDDLDYSFGVGFRSLGGGAFTCLERGDHVVARGPGAFPHSTCWIAKIQPYTPEMQAADHAAREAKQPLPVF